MYHGFGARKRVNNLKNQEPTTFQRLEIPPQFVSLKETVNTECFSQQIGHSIKRDIAATIECQVRLQKNART